MKKNSPALLLLIVLFLFSGSCTKDGPADTNNSTNASSTTSFITSGIWNITSFTEKTENKTADFSGLDFTFSADGKVAATGSKSTNGTWSYSPPAAGYYGGPASSATFTINIVSGSAFTKLSRAWNVGSSSATSIQLNHPEPLEDEHVTFTKK